MASSQDFLRAATIHGLNQKFPQSCNYSWPQAKISSELQLFMASNKNFRKAATIHGLKPRFPTSCKFFMASNKNFLKAATIHGLKQKFPQSCKSSWPKAKISFKVLVFMA
jgi:hypothetical protein